MTFAEYGALLETTAVITTVFQFLSGGLVCRKFIKKKSTGDSSGFPFLCGFLSCSLWLRYGFLSNEASLQFVNSIGTLLFFVYSCLYYVLTVNKQAHLRQFVLVAIVLISTTWYTSSIEEDDHALAIQIMGVICCIVTVCFFAAPLTNLVVVVRFKNAESLPLPLIAMSFLVSVQWLVYGIIIDDTFVQLPNFLGCMLSLLQLLLFVIYPPKSFASSSYRREEESNSY